LLKARRGHTTLAEVARVAGNAAAAAA
jgi:hypothetical protein